MSSRTELEDRRQAAVVAIDEIVRLAERGVSEHPTPTELEHAAHYESEAGMLRRRAQRLYRPPASGRGPAETEGRDELNTRAGYYEARAFHLRNGMPMPRALRTEAESLARVDALRREVVALLERFADTGPDELARFRFALKAPAGTDASAADLFLGIWAALGALGVVISDAGAVEFTACRGPLDSTVLVEREKEADGAPTDIRFKQASTPPGPTPGGDS